MYYTSKWKIYLLYIFCNTLINILLISLQFLLRKSLTKESLTRSNLFDVDWYAVPHPNCKTSVIFVSLVKGITKQLLNGIQAKYDLMDLQTEMLPKAEDPKAEGGKPWTTFVF